MASVEYEGASKSYGKVPALVDLSLSIRDGEFMVLVGPSGSGKTTALRLLAGLETLTAGTVRIGERVVNDVAPKDRNIAMVFQSYALYPHMSVFDNMAFGLRMRKVHPYIVTTKVQLAADTLGITHLLERKPKQLSGGERQRVALGRAIVREPDVFLMDEPLSNLDAQLRVQMRAELVRLHQKLGATFVYVTHDQEEAMTVGDRIAVLRGGQLQQVGTPREIYEHPANEFVNGFVATSKEAHARWVAKVMGCDA